MKIVQGILTFSIVCLLTSCVKDSHSLKWDWREGHLTYHQIAMEEVGRYGRALLYTTPRDYKRYCPRYPELTPQQRQLFWASLISSIARHESSHKTESAYQEDILNSAGNKVMSRGLLQMSFESARYYNPALKRPEELHDPRTNIRTGVLAVKKWVTTDGVIGVQESNGKWKGAARYWSTLRTNWKSEEIRSWLLSIEY